MDVSRTRGKERRLAPRAHVLGVRNALAAALLLAMGACVYGDSRCSPGQVLYDDAVCACPEGSTYTPQGCVTCGENEVGDANGCNCAPGFVRPIPEAACAPPPLTLGVACDTGTAPCGDSRYDHCQVTSGTSGYCTTTGCSSSAECDGGYACDTSAVPSFCKRPPSGLRQPCSSPADCAGTEATWCDTFMLNACLVQGCSVAAQDCFEGYQCCDLSMFGVPAPLCLPAGAC